MRKIIYLFIFATVLLIVKAFFLDDYIAEYKNRDANISTESNVSSEAAQAAAEPDSMSASQENNTSVTHQEKNISSDKPEMPLEKLGDELTKHIKL